MNEKPKKNEIEKWKIRSHHHRLEGLEGYNLFQLFLVLLCFLKCARAQLWLVAQNTHK